MVEGDRLTALFPGASRVDDPGQFQDVARGTPATMTAGPVFWIRADLSGLGHQ